MFKVCFPPAEHKSGWPQTPSEKTHVVLPGVFWLRTNGVNTNGAVAKVMNFDRSGGKGYVRPGTFGKIKVG